MNQPDKSVVLDTNIVSLIVRQDTRAQFYKQRIEAYSPCISFQTLEELKFWAEKNEWGASRKEELGEHIKRYRIIWPNERLAHISAQIRADRERAGRRLTTADAWIAATAIFLNCPLASHDYDFSGIPNLDVIRSP